MKTAVSTYSFSRLMNAGAMTQLDCIKKAKEMGFDGVEVVEIQPHDNCGKSDYAKRLREEADKVGIVISNFCTGANFLDKDLNGQIKQVMENVDYASILGVKNMRHDLAWSDDKNYVPFSKALPIIAKATREITMYAKDKEIKTCSENHGYYCQDSERVEAVINAVDDPNYGWLGDMGNFLCADENPVTGFGRLAPYAIYAHAKDFVLKKATETNPGEMFFTTRGGNYLKGTVVGHGNVPIMNCLKALKRVGYDGFVSIEFEGFEDVLDAIRVGKQNLENYFSLI